MTAAPAAALTASPALSLTWLKRRASDVYLVTGLLLAALHGSGLGGDYAMLVLALLTPAFLVVGVRWYRPRPAWPWYVFVAAGVVWSVAAVIRSAAGSTGDLTSDRNLLPDAFALPGYALFGAALVGLLWARGREARSRALLIDSITLAMSALLLSWVLLIDPVLNRQDAAPIAQLAILVYPPISVLLVAVATQLAYAGRMSARAHHLLLGGMIALLLGDMLFVPLEADLLEPPGRLLEVPYALAYALIGAAALHPTMRMVGQRHHGPSSTQRSRLALVASALLVPAILLLTWTPADLVHRLLGGTLVLALSAAAVTRVLLAMHRQAMSEARLSYQATHDELTGLPNRAAALAATQRALDDARHLGWPVALIFLDVDQFKLVNDTYGHTAGDELLVACAERLVEAVGTNHLVARLSGDEFVVVVPALDRTGARDLAERVRRAFALPFEVLGDQYITASVGVAVAEHPFKGVDAVSLVRDADTAMYRAKEAGRDAVVVFDMSMHRRTARRLELEQGLRQAMERGELAVQYQPVVDMVSGRVHGVEALMRWQSPNGPVSPSEFVTVAEETGLIAPLGEWVLSEACAQVARWRHLTGCEDLTVAVNVSARQLVATDMVSMVADVLEETALPADALWLEITESVMWEDSVDTIATLVALRGLGVHLSLDDFGTGYSSLSYLNRFPVEQVKIDRSFVSVLSDNPDDGSFVAAIMAIAQALDLSVVAEGVERPEQAGHLRALGCRLAQGYLYSWPLSAIDVGPVLLDRNGVAVQQVDDEW
jgi:diguanylate cyclase (GGDEF)-like protein